MCSLLVVVGILMHLVVNTYASKILLIPANADSHVIYFTRLGVDLAKLGHVATVIAPSIARVPDLVTTEQVENFTYVQYPVHKSTSQADSDQQAEMLRMIAMATTESPLQFMRLFAEANLLWVRDGEQECTLLLDNVQ